MINSASTAVASLQPSRVRGVLTPHPPQRQGCRRADSCVRGEDAPHAMRRGRSGDGAAEGGRT